MSLKFGLNLTRNYSHNFSIPKRGKKKLKYIIIHYTGMRREIDAIRKLCDSRSKVSSHYFIKNNGNILNLVPDLYEAWHAGISSWKNLNSLNKYSIGIEIHNQGHDHGYKSFSSKQIASLVKLLNYLKKKYNIKNRNILGHSDIAPNRKKDPGEKFPWKKLAQKKLCFWHNLSEKKITKHRKSKIEIYEKKVFINNLYKIGYRRIRKINLGKNNQYLIQAFQRRFRQDLVDGKIDKECLLISKNLLKS